MSFSFYEIERRKGRLIYLPFMLLVLIYFVFVWIFTNAVIIAFLVKLQYLPRNISCFTDYRVTLASIVIAITAGIIHWLYVTNRTTEKFLEKLKAKPLDETDLFHRRFKNIIDEVTIASGQSRIEGWVIPTPAVNAFALADLDGRNVIGVTEGLLAKLTRDQLETVVGHEFAHIVTGDCLITTVTTAIFGLYSAVLRSIDGTVEEGIGQGMLILIFVYILTGIFSTLSSLLNIFISRQQKYRADAIAVRLTRNPLALAEALYLITRSWRGGGLPAEGLSNVFITNTSYSSIDESEGIIADLISTHPPMRKRINTLLAMAHTDADTMAGALTEKRACGQKPSMTAEKIIETWFVFNPSAKWSGPYTMAEMNDLPWFNKTSWVYRATGSDMKMALEEPALVPLLSDKKPPTELSCPKCRTSLTKVLYEGAQVLMCDNCKGYLIDNDRTVRIILRRLQGFSPEVHRMVSRIKSSMEDKDSIIKMAHLKPVFKLNCPKCNDVMIRRSYSIAYPVEIDFCMSCKLTWFDKNELEILQLLIEDYTGQLETYYADDKKRDSQKTD